MKRLNYIGFFLLILPIIIIIIMNTVLMSRMRKELWTESFKMEDW